MIDDADGIPRATRINAEVCIVGAGAAGITLARELIATRRRVVVLESGGLDLDPETHALSEGSASGLPYDLAASRLRFFGGSTNHWTGMCRPLEPHDFVAREWVPNSGWPIGRDDLDPFYRRAQKICDLGPFRYDLDWWLRRLDGVTPLLHDERITPALFQIGPGTRFGQKFRRELRRADKVRVLLHANATNVRARDGRVEGVDVATLSGNRFAVDAPVVVLALGGIENPRLLLASRDASPAGLGNEHDLVGRYFMDHPEIKIGRVVLSDNAPDPQLSFFVGISFTEAGLPAMTPARTVLGSLVITPDLAEELRARSCAMTLGPPTFDDRPQPGGGVAPITADAVDGLLGDVEGRRATGRAGRTVTVFGGREIEVTNRFDLLIRGEQAPNPDSRITLSEDVDALGTPRAELRWLLSDDDWEQMRRSVRILGQELGRSGLGRVYLDPTTPEAVTYGNHHIGTTRMHVDPARGVVDANGQVHGVANLFAAGSSVFPTSGFANPTLTIVALALRLAKHLEREVLA